MAKNKTEEDLIRNLEALGFDDYEDELCKRDRCQKGQVCLFTMLELIQENYNESFFNGILTDKDFIISAKDMYAMLSGKGCHLPKKNSKAFKAIEFFLDADEALCYNNAFNESIEVAIKRNIVKHCGKILYLFVVSIVHGEDSKLCYDELESIIMISGIFKEDDSKELLKRLKIFRHARSKTIHE